MDTSNFTGIIFQMFGSWIFWIIIIFAMCFLGTLALIIKKSRALDVLVIEVCKIGGRKINIRDKSNSRILRGALKGGWFKDKSTFFGLWDYGSFDVFKTNDGRTVRDVSDEDYHERNGRKCLIVARSPENPSILVPLDRFEIENYKLLSKIAPADFTGASVDIFKKAVEETKTSNWKEIAIVVILGLLVVGAFVTFIVLSQLQKQTTAEAGAQLKDAREACGPDKLAGACVSIFQSLNENTGGIKNGPVSNAP